MPNKVEIPSIRQIIDKYNSKNDFTSSVEVLSVNNTKSYMKGISIAPNSVRSIIARFESGENLSEPTQRPNRYGQINSTNKKDKIDPEIVKSRIQHFSQVNEVVNNSYINDYKAKEFKELLPRSKRPEFTSLRSQFETYEDENEYQDEAWFEELTSSELNFSQTSYSQSDLDLRSTQNENPELDELRDTTKSIINSFGTENNVNGITHVETVKIGYYNNLHSTEDFVAIGYQYLLDRFISDLGISVDNLDNINGNSLRRTEDSIEANVTPSIDETDFGTREGNVFVLETTQLDVDYAENVFIESLESTSSQKSGNSETESTSNYKYFQDVTNYESFLEKNKNMSDEKDKTGFEQQETKTKLSEQESQTDCEQYTETFNNLLKQIQNEVNNYSSLKHKEKVIEQETQTDFEQHSIAKTNTSAEQMCKETNDEDFSITTMDQTENAIRNVKSSPIEGTQGKSIDFINNSLLEQDAELDLEESSICVENLAEDFHNETRERHFSNNYEERFERIGTDLEQYADEFENLVMKIQNEDDIEDTLEKNEKLFEEDTETDLQQYVEVFDSLIGNDGNSVQNVDFIKRTDLIGEAEHELKQSIDAYPLVDGQSEDEGEFDDFAEKNSASIVQDIKETPNCSSEDIRSEIISSDSLGEIEKLKEAETNLKKYDNTFENSIKQRRNDLSKNQKLLNQDNKTENLKPSEIGFNALVKEHHIGINNGGKEENQFERINEVNFESTGISDNLFKQMNDNAGKVDNLDKNEQLLYEVTDNDLNEVAYVFDTLIKQNEQLLTQIPYFGIKQDRKTSNTSVKQVDCSNESIKLIEHKSDINSAQSTENCKSPRVQVKQKHGNLDTSIKIKKSRQDTERNLEQYSSNFNQLIKKTQEECQNETAKDYEKHFKLDAGAFSKLTEEVCLATGKNVTDENYEMCRINDFTHQIDKEDLVVKSVNSFEPIILTKLEHPNSLFEQIPSKETVEDSLEENKSLTSTDVTQNLNKRDDSFSNNTLKNVRIENLIRNSGRRWSAGNIDLIESRSKFKKLIKENYDNETPRRSSVADIIEEFNSKSNTMSTKSTENLRQNSTRFRIRSGSSGDTKLSVPDKTDVEKSGLESENIDLQIDVEKLTNIFEQRIAENNVTRGKYLKIDALREKIIDNKKSTYAPKILDDVIEIEEGNMENLVNINEAKGQLDSGNYSNIQAEYQTDQRNVHNPEQQRDLIQFYNACFERVSNPIFTIMSIYCVFCLVVEILKFLLFMLTLPCFP